MNLLISVKEYLQDRHLANQIEFTDPNMEAFRAAYHRHLNRHDKAKEELGWDKRKYRIYRWAYELYSPFFCQ